MVLVMRLLWVDWSKLVRGWPQRMPGWGVGVIFLKFLQSVIHQLTTRYEGDLINMGRDSEADIAHNDYNNLDAHGNVLSVAYLSIGPSPTPHFSGSCARHRFTLPMLTTYLMKLFIIQPMNEDIKSHIMVNGRCGCKVLTCGALLRMK